MPFPRLTGILLHPTSLPSRGGIGDFGPDPIARQHADLELALIRHPISPSGAVSDAIIPDSSGTKPLIANRLR